MPLLIVDRRRTLQKLVQRRSQIFQIRRLQQPAFQVGQRSPCRRFHRRIRRIRNAIRFARLESASSVTCLAGAGRHLAGSDDDEIVTNEQRPGQIDDACVSVGPLERDAGRDGRTEIRVVFVGPLGAETFGQIDFGENFADLAMELRAPEVVLAEDYKEGEE